MALYIASLDVGMEYNRSWKDWVVEMTAQQAIVLRRELELMDGVNKVYPALTPPPAGPIVSCETARSEIKGYAKEHLKLPRRWPQDTPM
jgi:hypothetical protein